VFGPEDSYEMQETCRQLVSMKATYSASLYVRQVNLVLVAASYVQYLHTMPNLLQLKWRQVQFCVVDRSCPEPFSFRLSLRPIFAKGGVLTVSRRFLLDKELNSFDHLTRLVSSQNGSWIVRIPSALFEDYSRFIMNFGNEVCYQG
jgi:hypothetical protein